MSRPNATPQAQNANVSRETPRLFGANNEDAGLESARSSDQDDFTARWWPGEMQQRMPPRKPR